MAVSISPPGGHYVTCILYTAHSLERKQGWTPLRNFHIAHHIYLFPKHTGHGKNLNLARYFTQVTESLQEPSPRQSQGSSGWSATILQGKQKVKSPFLPKYLSQGQHREYNRKNSRAPKHGTQQSSVDIATLFWPSARNYHIQNSIFILKKEITLLEMRKGKKT